MCVKCSSYEFVLDVSSNMIWQCLEDGEVPYANHSWINFTGLPSLLTSSLWHTTVHPDDVEQAVLAWDTCCKTKQSSPSPLPCRLRNTQDGEYKWHQLSYHYDSTNSCAWWVGVGATIPLTTSSILKVPVPEVAEMYWRVVEKAAYPIITVDEEGVVYTFNQASQDMFIYSKGDVLGKPFAEIIDIHGAIADSTITPSSTTVQVSAKKKDGTYIPVSMSIGQFEQFGKQLYVLVLHEAEGEIKMQQELHRSKDNFLRNMSHELRTPLFGLLGTMSTMQPPEDPTLQMELRHMEDCTWRLLSVVNNMIDFYKLENLYINPLPHTFQPHELVADLCAAHVSCVNNGVALSFHLDPAVPQEVVADASFLKHSLSNLIGNALRFTHQGSVFVLVTADEIHDGRYMLNFIVVDSGIGISYDFFPKMFQPFQQMDDSDSRKYGGVGLGLAVSKHLIELMGGTITFKSALGEGSEFKMSVPVELPREASESTEDTLAFATVTPSPTSSSSGSPIPSPPHTPTSPTSPGALKQITRAPSLLSPISFSHTASPDNTRTHSPTSPAVKQFRPPLSPVVVPSTSISSSSGTPPAPSTPSLNFSPTSSPTESPFHSPSGSPTSSPPRSPPLPQSPRSLRSMQSISPVAGIQPDLSPVALPASSTSPPSYPVWPPFLLDAQGKPLTSHLCPNDRPCPVCSTVRTPVIQAPRSPPTHTHTHAGTSFFNLPDLTGSPLQRRGTYAAAHRVGSPARFVSPAQYVSPVQAVSPSITKSYAPSSLSHSGTMLRPLTMSSEIATETEVATSTAATQTSPTNTPILASILKSDASTSPLSALDASQGAMTPTTTPTSTPLLPARTVTPPIVSAIIEPITQVTTSESSPLSTTLLIPVSVSATTSTDPDLISSSPVLPTVNLTLSLLSPCISVVPAPERREPIWDEPRISPRVVVMESPFVSITASTVHSSPLVVIEPEAARPRSPHAPSPIYTPLISPVSTPSPPCTPVANAWPEQPEFITSLVSAAKPPIPKLPLPTMPTTPTSTPPTTPTKTKLRTTPPSTPTTPKTPRTPTLVTSGPLAILANLFSQTSPTKPSPALASSLSSSSSSPSPSPRSSLTTSTTSDSLTITQKASNALARVTSLPTLSKSLSQLQLNQQQQAPAGPGPSSPLSPLLSFQPVARTTSSPSLPCFLGGPDPSSPTPIKREAPASPYSPASDITERNSPTSPRRSLHSSLGSLLTPSPISSLPTPDGSPLNLRQRMHSSGPIEIGSPTLSTSSMSPPSSPYYSPNFSPFSPRLCAKEYAIESSYAHSALSSPSSSPSSLSNSPSPHYQANSPLFLACSPSPSNSSPLSSFLSASPSFSSPSSFSSSASSSPSAFSSSSPPISNSSPPSPTPIHSGATPLPVGLRILVVEDNILNQNIIKKMLERVGWEVVQALNGREALDILFKEASEKYVGYSKFNIILMDCQMPVLDGYQATRRIRKKEHSRPASHIRIIAITASSCAEDERKCYDAGMDGFIAKPVSPQTLYNTIAR